MPSHDPVPSDRAAWMSPIEMRKARADYYFDAVLGGQYEWYARNAARQKTRYLAFAMLVVVLGAVISVLQVAGADAWMRYLTAALGAAVSIIRAVDTLLRPGETWHAYRKASESMRREYRLYVNDADPYGDAPDEETAYRLLVERIETVIAEEQQLYWQFHATGAARAKRAPVVEEGE